MRELLVEKGATESLVRAKALYAKNAVRCVINEMHA